MSRGTAEYALIRRVYADRRAARSGVLLIDHIDEGLRVLEWIGASERAQRAFCLHPLVQADADLSAHLDDLRGHDPTAVALAMEYRWVANNCLADRAISGPEDIQLSVLPEVNAMLVADKVQNRKDFERYHAATHARRLQLARYFRQWLARLGVDEATYQTFVDRLRAG